MKVLSDDQIKAKLAALRGWELADDKISKTYRFADFAKALEFVNQVAAAAESMDHHPDILIHYNQVTLSLWTHEENGLTDRDFKLAQDIEGIAVMNL